MDREHVRRMLARKKKKFMITLALWAIYKFITSYIETVRALDSDNYTSVPSVLDNYKSEIQEQWSVVIDDDAELAPFGKDSYDDFIDASVKITKAEQEFDTMDDEDAINTEFKQWLISMFIMVVLVIGIIQHNVRNAEFD